jgi:hypothetical protein
MTAKRPHEIRLGLARGHIELGELDQALAMLERAATEAPEPSAVLAMLRELASACDVTPGSPVEGVRVLHRKLVAVSPPAAPAPPPAPVRAAAPPRAPARPATPVAPPQPPPPPSRSQRQIASLERWLARVRQRFGGESRA